MENQLRKIDQNFKQYEKEELIEVIEQIHDLFAIYLDTDLAGDNECRRKKLAAVTMVTQLFRNNT